MMSRLTWFLLCAFSGALMVGDGLVVPAHLRAVDARVVQQAGRNTTDLIGQGLALVKEEKLGAAQLLLRAAQENGVRDWQRLGLAITNSAAQHPGWLVWGGVATLAWSVCSTVIRGFRSPARSLLPTSWCARRIGLWCSSSCEAQPSLVSRNCCAAAR